LHGNVAAGNGVTPLACITRLRFVHAATEHISGVTQERVARATTSHTKGVEQSIIADDHLDGLNWRQVVRKLAWQTEAGSSGHSFPLAIKSANVIHSKTNPFGAPGSPAVTSIAMFEDADVEHATAGLSS
jgi:hypothetical protein